MYLEQRIEQLENVTVEHGKQIEMIATGLATLTTTVNSGFNEMRNEFKLVHEKFAAQDRRFERLEGRMDRLEADVAVLKTDVAEIKDRLDVMSGQFGKMTEGIETLVELIKTKMN